MTRPRSRRVRTILAWAALCLSACGHYGPPIRSQPTDATGAAAEPTDPAAEPREEETRRDAP